MINIIKKVIKNRKKYFINFSIKKLQSISYGNAVDTQFQSKFYLIKQKVIFI